MRRFRRMTVSDRVELGVFLALLAGGLVVLTSVMKLGGIPEMAAWSNRSANSTQAQAPAVAPSEDANAIPAIPQPQPPMQWSQWVPAQPQDFAPASSPLPRSAQEIPTARQPAAPKAKAKPPEDIRYYQGSKYRFVRKMKLRVTAYAPDPRCTYPYPGTTTASGKSVKTNGGRLVAADTAVIPMHALVAVPGYARDDAVPVLDRGGAIKGSRLDVLMPTFEKAQEWGSKQLTVKIYEPVK